MNEEIRNFQQLIRELHSTLTNINAGNVEWQIQDDYFGIDLFTNSDKRNYATRLQICLHKRSNESDLHAHRQSGDPNLGNRSFFTIYEYKKGKNTKYAIYTNKNKLVADIVQLIKGNVGLS